MTDLAAIREGLAANLDAIPGVQCSAYLLSSPTPPAIEVVPAAITYDVAGSRGLDRWRFTARAFVGFANERGAQKRLDRLLAGTGPESVKATLEADCTLGGTVDDLRVVSATGYQLYDRAGSAPLLGAEWEIDVLDSP